MTLTLSFIQVWFEVEIILKHWFISLKIFFNWSYRNSLKHVYFCNYKVSFYKIQLNIISSSLSETIWNYRLRSYITLKKWSTQNIFSKLDYSRGKLNRHTLYFECFFSIRQHTGWRGQGQRLFKGYTIITKVKAVK